MANTEIDSLSLDISITGLNKEDVANIDRLSKAVQRLTKSLKDADFSKLQDIKIPKGLKNFQVITQNLKPGSIINGTNINELEQKIDDVETQTINSVENISDGVLVIADNIEKVNGTAVATAKTLGKTVQNIGKDIDKTKKKLSATQKLLKRIKTIAFIKAIRAVLNAIVQTVKTGITNLAQFDKAFNETISSIKTSGTNIADSLALTFRPLIESLEPFIVAFSQALATVGNEVSRLQAIMKGTSTYTKINAKYMEDFANASQKAQKFSFDTFETLSGAETNNKFETAETTSSETDEKDIEFIKTLQEFLQSAFNLIAQIMGEIKQLISYLKPIIKLLLDIGSFLNEILGMLLEITFDVVNPLLDLVMQIVEPILSIIKPVLEFIKQILQPIKNIIEMIVNLVVDILNPIVEMFKPMIQELMPELNVILDILTILVDMVGIGLTGAFQLVITMLKPFAVALQVIADIVNEIVGMFTSMLQLDFGGFKDHLEKLIWSIGGGILKLLASLIDTIVNSFIDVINLIFAPLNALSDFFGWGWEIGIPHINLASLVPSFATGGFVGEVWQMNEYGNPEMLYNANNNSNNTAVINQAQLSLAFEQAIYNTGLLDAIAKAGVINIDGRAIAQSTNFKNEINRTNPNLNIR